MTSGDLCRQQVATTDQPGLRPGPICRPEWPSEAFFKRCSECNYARWEKIACKERSYVYT